MGLFDFFRGKTEKRGYTEMKQLNQLTDIYGVSINEHTALRISAVYAAVNIISEAIARVPLEVRQMTSTGDKRRPDHTINRLISFKPNGKQTSFVWRQATQGQVLLKGNGYAYIERNGGASPVAIHFLRSEEVYPIRINQDTMEEEVTYNIPKFGITALPQDMLWIPAFAVNDYEAQSPIRYAATMLGGAYAAMDFNSASYKKGGFFKGVLTILGRISSADKTPAQRAKEISEQFDAQYSNGGTPVLYDGSTYTPINMSHRDLQFIEYMRYSVEDIARIFNVPLSKLKNLDRAIQSNMESQMLEFATDTMQPWFSKWENELTDKLLTEEERMNGLHIAFDEKALTRGDTAARSEYYNKLFYLSALSPNDIRRAEGLEDREGGDQYFSGVNLLTQEQVKLQTEKMEMEIEQGNVQGSFAPANSDKNMNDGTKL